MRHPATTESKVHNAVYRAWKNKGLIDESEPTNIFTNRKKIVAFIESHGYADNTKKQHYLSLANAMKLLNKNKIADNYVEKAVALNNKQEERYSKNQRTDKQEEASTWGEIMEKFLELSAVKEPTHLQIQQRLLCALNVYQPPLRAEPSSMKVVVDGVPSTNSIVKTKGGWSYFLTKYKTKKAYGDQTIKLSKKASAEVTRSLAEFPREYIYVNSKGGPIGKGGYATLIKQTLGKQDSVNTLRSSYASHALGEGDLSQADKSTIAAAMLTSVDRLDTVYRKTSPSPEPVEEADAIDTIEGKVSEFQPKPRGRPRGAGAEPVDRKAYSKAYYEANKAKRQESNSKYFQEKKLDIYKRQVLKRISDGKKVSDTTKQKYGIE
jgi:hypothetical protein